MEIDVISFDADQTLWDFAGVYRKALDATATAMVERGYLASGQVTADELKAVRDEVVLEFQGQPHSLEEVRERSFEEVLARAGHDAPARAASELVEFYLQIRFDAIKLYPEVADSLRRLGTRFRLGLITNGNTYPDRCGLPDTFDAQVLGPEHGFEKPDPRAFTTLADALSVPLDRIMHVGDGWDDVTGANAVGATSVFINRTDHSPAWSEAADLHVHDLRELETLLA